MNTVARTDELKDECEIAAAREVALTVWTGKEAA